MAGLPSEQTWRAPELGGIWPLPGLTVTLPAGVGTTCPPEAQVGSAPAMPLATRLVVITAPPPTDAATRLPTRNLRMQFSPWNAGSRKDLLRARRTGPRTVCTRNPAFRRLLSAPPPVQRGTSGGRQKEPPRGRAHPRLPPDTHPAFPVPEVVPAKDHHVRAAASTTI